MLIDIPEALANLKTEGYNVRNGSAGYPYQVKKSKIVSYLNTEHDLDNLTEQEIIFLNLQAAIKVAPSEPEEIALDVDSFWASNEYGILDSRPLILNYHESVFKRILDHGGIITVFLSTVDSFTYLQGHSEQYRGFRPTKSPITISNVSFLPIYLRSKDDVGEEVAIVENFKPQFLLDILQKYTKKAKFYTLINPQNNSEYIDGKNVETTAFFPCLQNKYNNTIGGLCLFGNKQDPPGFLLLLPQFEELPNLIRDLMNRVFPEISPHLFPFSERGRWINSDEYLPKEIIDRQYQIKTIREEAEKSINLIQSEIKELKEKNSHLFNILTSNDDELVTAVEMTLKDLGFKDVINMDRERGNKTDQIKEEDIQIRDQEPVIIIEIKGINAPTPDDDVCRQVTKYVSRRAREGGKFQGLTIINTERGIPPKMRRDEPYTPKQIQDATEGCYLLATTWDIWRLLCGFNKYKWDSESVKSLFYGTGRLIPIPNCYTESGKITNFYGEICVYEIIFSNEVKIGDKIGFFDDVEFYEEEIQSMRFEGKDIETASIGQKVTIKTSISKEIIMKRKIAYKVSQK